MSVQLSDLRRSDWEREGCADSGLTGSFQAFVDDFRPTLLQHPRRRLVFMSFGVARSPRHLIRLPPRAAISASTSRVDAAASSSSGGKNSVADPQAPASSLLRTNTTPNHGCRFDWLRRLDQAGVILLDVADDRNWPASMTFCSAGYDGSNVLSCGGLVSARRVHFCYAMDVRCRAPLALHRARSNRSMTW